ncbi:hypothetical protein LEP1GSC082_1058 [Leptospira kirschneri str. H2]|uniref:Uncharacterized protein n=1 Tax=Leptospira kirschneri str. H1 TaxID=1049966 RepID=A0A0E2B620_9LEPT|nr:hypothetical protein LEP1GSC081_2769 [Leptospira kirschneri str. H1]EKO62852.1 hypothetical protein LEP1GSC082_1058 [Leptospira kirschneri str. H2]
MIKQNQILRYTLSKKEIGFYIRYCKNIRKFECYNEGSEMVPLFLLSSFIFNILNQSQSFFQ